MLGEQRGRGAAELRAVVEKRKIARQRPSDEQQKEGAAEKNYEGAAAAHSAESI